MNNFQFFKGYNEKQLTEVDVSEMGFQTPVIQLFPNTIQPDNVEFCFQFDDNEPVSFGTGTNDLHIHISPTENSNIIFNDNGRVFKIFAREIVNEN